MLSFCCCFLPIILLVNPLTIDTSPAHEAPIPLNSHPFRMDLDGRNKIDLTKGSKEFTYGFSSSSDGKHVAYHKNYQVYVADADGSNARRVETGNSFNFAPSWSADNQWVLFLSGEHYNCHPHVVRADGTGLRKLADRGGYKGVIAFLDVPDFHDGSSDVPVWSRDGKSVYYTAQKGQSVELFNIALEGTPVQMTHSAPGTLHYHPQPSLDGNGLAFGSKRTACDSSMSCNSKIVANNNSQRLPRDTAPCGLTGGQYQPLLQRSNQ